MLLKPIKLVYNHSLISILRNTGFEFNFMHLAPKFRNFVFKYSFFNPSQYYKFKKLRLRVFLNETLKEKAVFNCIIIILINLSHCTLFIKKILNIWT